MKIHVQRGRRAAIILTCLMPVLASGCSAPRELSAVEAAHPGEQVLMSLNTQKAAYKPGEPVEFSLELDPAGSGLELIVQYRHLGTKIGSRKVAPQGGRASWTWTPPKEDFQGYMAEVFVTRDEKIVDQMNIAVDVSSDWARFPRYGYLADFPAMDRKQMERVIERLNRFHINGIQFYDWQSKHHDPLPLEGGKPAAKWKDIANREVAYDTVKGYIDLAHSRGMKAMNYNLLFGAYDDAEQDGVRQEWGLFKDRDRTEQDKHPLPGWASDIMLVDPGNPGWQDYIVAKEQEVFRHLPFDGWHVDQLGPRGTLYDATGRAVNLPQDYVSFLKAAKKSLDVDYVMNAVDQYGQGLLAALAPVEFLYTEVWSHPRYDDLKEVIDKNGRSGRGKLNTVLAAYMNYDHSKSGKGSFNAPGVLLADAVIFAAGGSHLELGENMLSNEYFPNRNLSIPAELEEKLIDYYDFQTAYQNLLRDGLEAFDAKAAGTSGVEVSPRAEPGKVWSFAKQKEGVDVIHFINLTQASTMEWKDNEASQTEPGELTDVGIKFQAERKVKRILLASPDYYEGSSVELEFEQKDGSVFVKLPKLHYWDLLQVRYE